MSTHREQSPVVSHLCVPDRRLRAAGEPGGGAGGDAAEKIERFSAGFPTPFGSRRTAPWDRCASLLEGGPHTAPRGGGGATAGPARMRIGVASWARRVLTRCLV